MKSKYSGMFPRQKQDRAVQDIISVYVFHVCQVLRAWPVLAGRTQDHDPGYPGGPGSITERPENSAKNGSFTCHLVVGNPMSNLRLPPEILDYIVGLLHDRRDTLKKCCFVSKSWVARFSYPLYLVVSSEAGRDRVGGGDDRDCCDRYQR